MSSASPQVVMFPGVGAGYPGMVRRYLDAHPEDRQLLEGWWSTVDLDPDGVPPQDPRGMERLRQLEIHFLNLLWWRRSAGPADGAAVCGHSLGYYAALVAAEVLDAESSLRLVDTVFQVGWRHFGEADQLVFVVTTREPQDFDSLVAGGSLEILSENNPRQRVLCGRRDDYQRLLRQLDAALLGAVDLGTRLPFHSPRMVQMSEPLAAAVRALGLQPRRPSREIWSHIDARPLDDAGSAMDLVLAQPHQRVRWEALVHALAEAGCRHFLEVGPNRVLSQIVRWCDPGLRVSHVDTLRR